jgi:hypothetical protein
VNEGLSLLLEQFRDSEVLKGLVSSSLKQLDLLESEILAARESMSLENAPRFMLERIAKIVGQECSGFDTETLRLWIRARIAVNRSQATIEDLIRILRILGGQDVAVEIREHPEIAFTVFPKVVLTHKPKSVLAIIDDAKPLGVRAYLQYATNTPVFTFDAEHRGGFFTDIIGGEA